MDWIWKKPWGWENSYIGNAEGTEVVLNGHFSTGMSFVTSSSTLSERDHHYWEVQLLYGCFGTATSIGVVCTLLQPDSRHSNFSENTFEFMRGWTHNGSLVNQEGDDEAVLSNHSYQQGFHNGCIIGVHFDRLRGMLSYRRDNVFLGIAFSDLHNKSVSAMVSSTATNCVVRLKAARSYDESLQLLSSISAPPKSLWSTRLTFPSELWKKLTAEYPWLATCERHPHPQKTQKENPKRRKVQAARSRVETSDSDSDSNHSVCSPMHTPPILTNFVDLRDETDDIAEWPQLNAVRNESELQGD